jgi:hypothetical protein
MLRLRPWPTRIRKHYAEYRRVGLGRAMAFYWAVRLAFGLF